MTTEPSKEKKEMKSAILCSHANEVPNICECPSNCYCQTNTCKNRKEIRSCPHCDDPDHALRYANEMCMWKQIDSLIQLVRELRDQINKFDTIEHERGRIGEEDTACKICIVVKKADSFLKEHGGMK